MNIVIKIIGTVFLSLAIISNVFDVFKEYYNYFIAIGILLLIVDIGLSYRDWRDKEAMN